MPWTPTDDAQTRAKGALLEWANWLTKYSVKGYLGEFGYPTNTLAGTNTAGDATAWNALASGVYTECDERDIWATQWGVGVDLRTYELAIYSGNAGFGALDTARVGSGPLEAHLATSAKRGVGLNGLAGNYDNPSYNNSNPGTVGTDYFQEPAASYTFLAGRGIDTVRIAFAWERLQPTLSLTTDESVFPVTPDAAGALNSAYLGYIQTQVSRAGAAGLGVILDMHNYGGYKTSGGNQKLTKGAFEGTVTASAYHLADVWARLSAVFKNDATVVGYGIMNEPNGLTGGVASWKSISYDVVRRLRLLGDNKMVLLSGYNFSKVQGWATLHGAPWVYDPNLRYEAHMYNDSESSTGGKENSVYEQTYASNNADAPDVVTPPPSPLLPIVVPSSGSVPAALRAGSTAGPRLHLKGVNVWGLPDDVTNNVSIAPFGVAFHQHQYADRVGVCNTIQAWGGKAVRMRMLAVDYNGAPSGNTDSLTKAQIIQRVVAWRDAVVAEGMYFCPCTWDALDGAYSGANFATNSAQLYPLFSDVYAALGEDPMVFYEFSNEPNNISFAQWTAVMQGAITHFRETMGYTGVLVIDPPNWANSGGSTSATGNPAGYSDSAFSALEAFDGGRLGMGGKHQIVFAKHDYSNNGGYPGNVFSQTNWTNGMGGADIKHLTWENEFGNYNSGGPDPDTSDSWSAAMAAAARDRFAAKTNFVGAAPFLFGPWSDANSITDADDVTPNGTWGDTVKDIYFGTGTPPATTFSPGIVSGADWTTVNGSADAGVSLGADLMRVEFDVARNPGAAGTDRTFMDGVFTFFANRGIKILMLAGWQGVSGHIPSTGEAQNMGDWAQRYGPGGDFWTGYGGTDRPVTHIEWGNETNYNYQNSSAPSGTAGYTATANAYGSRFQTAYNDIAATGKAVGLLCQGTPTDSGSQSWIDGIFQAVPGIIPLVSGWTVHPYGNDWSSRMSNWVVTMANKGIPTSMPIDITEVGIATNNLRVAMDDSNYGWGNLTWAQAGTELTNMRNGMRNSAWGPRIRHFMLYQAKERSDASNPGDKEFYFGGLNDDLSEKGTFSTAFRTTMAL